MRCVNLSEMRFSLSYPGSKESPDTRSRRSFQTAADIQLFNTVGIKAQGFAEFILCLLKQLLKIGRDK